ncbi:unnamed protein product, partial [Symbiodinium sp. KB8]
GSLSLVEGSFIPMFVLLSAALLRLYPSARTQAVPIATLISTAASINEAAAIAEVSFFLSRSRNLVLRREILCKDLMHWFLLGMSMLNSDQTGIGTESQDTADRHPGLLEDGSRQARRGALVKLLQCGEPQCYDQEVLVSFAWHCQEPAAETYAVAAACVQTAASAPEAAAPAEEEEATAEVRDASLVEVVKKLVQDKESDISRLAGGRVHSSGQLVQAGDGLREPERSNVYTTSNIFEEVGAFLAARRNHQAATAIAYVALSSSSTKARAFPSFDRAWGPKQDIAVMREARRPGAQWEESTARAAQAAVNNLRKAEQKVARLGREKTDKATRFAAYEKEIRASFAAEEKRYHAIQERLSDDLAEAHKQLNLAKEASNGSGCGRVQDSAYGVTSGANACLHKTLPPLVLLGPRKLLLFVRRVERPAPMKEKEEPLPEKAPKGPSIGHSYGAASPSTMHHRSSPYPPTSPVGQHMAADITRTAETAPAPEQHAAAAEEHPERSSKILPTKDAAKAPPEKLPTGGTSLSQKLDDKRRKAVGSAMDPFRQKPDVRPPHVGPVPTEPLQDTGQNPAPNIVDDDMDELSGAASPGLGRLDG